ncbi:hypothetical protein ACNSOO_04525 [Aliarcobacter lanthieri]|uniref:hypothetical protein n=1 Tax=Aliarcobacter lanthieri TaxID=1355374 RepID=UPI003AAE28A8
MKTIIINGQEYNYEAGFAIDDATKKAIRVVYPYIKDIEYLGHHTIDCVLLNNNATAVTRFLNSKGRVDDISILEELKQYDYYKGDL